MTPHRHITTEGDCLLKGIATYVRQHHLALLALFIALGGTAWALQANSVKSRHIARGAVKAKQLDLDPRGVPMMATFSNLDTGTGSDNYAPLGNSHVATDNSMKRSRPRRSWRLACGSGSTTRSTPAVGSSFSATPRSPVPITTTALGCTVSAGENDCQSNARARIPEGVDLWFEEIHTGTTTGGYAEVGWRALLP